jgi:hypothetical protein
MESPNTPPPITTVSYIIADVPCLSVMVLVDEVPTCANAKNGRRLYSYYDCGGSLSGILKLRGFSQ